MGTKEMVLRLADQLRRDFWEKGAIVLRSPALVQGAECARRFVLGAALSRSEILSGYAPFALGWVGASGSGPGGFAALLGAGLGYFLGLGMLNGLRYVGDPDAMVSRLAIVGHLYPMQMRHSDGERPAEYSVKIIKELEEDAP